MSNLRDDYCILVFSVLVLLRSSIDVSAFFLIHVQAVVDVCMPAKILLCAIRLCGVYVMYLVNLTFYTTSRGAGFLL